MRNRVSPTSGRPISAATLTTARVLRYTLLALMLFALVGAQIAPAQASTIKIYVNTAAIDARTDLTAAQKTAVKTAMMNEIKSNLESAFGTGKVTVTNDPTQAKSANRSVNVDKDIGGSAATGHYWGEWTPGSSSTTVKLGTYMDVPAISSSFKTGDPPQWDTTKLGKALGTTAAHELAHSFSAGHDDRPAGTGVTQPNKMNSRNNANQIGGGLPLNKAAKDTLKANRSKGPCKTVTNYSSVCAQVSHWDDAMTTIDSLYHEPLSVTAEWNFSGELASFFDIGWWGPDTDNGLEDGNPWADFMYKSSMTGTPDDSPTITMFDGWTCHFVLRGRPDTPYEDQLFPVQEEGMILGDFIERPDGSEIARTLMLFWDLNNDGNNDVAANLWTGDPPNSPFNGFNLGIAPPISIGEAKLQVDGTYVRMADVQVSSMFQDSFYVQSMDRSSGVRVRMPDLSPTPGIQPGTLVTLSGKLETGINSERTVSVIDANDIEPSGPPMPLRPLGMSNRDVGGGDYEFIPGLWPSGQAGVVDGIGTNNIGLLIKTWGRVVEIEPALPPAIPTWIKIDDGTGRLIKCVAGEYLDIDPSWLGRYVVVTGVSSCEAEGDELVSVIRITELEQIPGH